MWPGCHDVMQIVASKVSWVGVAICHFSLGKTRSVVRTFCPQGFWKNHREIHGEIQFDLTLFWNQRFSFPAVVQCEVGFSLVAHEETDGVGQLSVLYQPFLKSIHGRSDERVPTGKVDRFGEAFGPKLAPWGRRTQLDPHCVATRAHWTCARCCAEMGGTYVGLPWGWTLYQLVLNEPLLVRSLVRYILHHSINWLSMRVEMRAARIDIYMVHAASKIFVSKLLVSFLFCTAASFRHCKWEPIDFPSWCWAGFRGSMLRGSIYIARKCPGAVCCLALPGKEWKLLSPNWDLFFSLNPSGFFSRKDMCTFAIDATHMVPHDLTKTAHAPVAYLIASPKLVSKSSWLTPDLPFWCVASGTKPFSWWN